MKFYKSEDTEEASSMHQSFESKLDFALGLILETDQSRRESDLNYSLEDFYVQDQAERQKYLIYLKKFPKWQEAAAEYAKDNNRDLNDLFNDAPRLKQVKKIITKNIKQIKSNQKMIKISWLLVQHMDKDVIFQKWFLNHLKKGTTEYEYLTDRVAVNNGLPQQYNTQNV